MKKIITDSSANNSPRSLFLKPHIFLTPGSVNDYAVYLKIHARINTTTNENRLAGSVSKTKYFYTFHCVISLLILNDCFFFDTSSCKDVDENTQNGKLNNNIGCEKVAW